MVTLPGFFSPYTGIFLPLWPGFFSPYGRDFSPPIPGFFSPYHPYITKQELNITK